jgi:hypothetical protein
MSRTGMGTWARDSSGQIRCAPSTVLLKNYTTLVPLNGGTVGPDDDPKMYSRISDGGYQLKKEFSAPSGWQKRQSLSNGREYFYNPGTGAAHWEPTEQIVQAAREEFRRGKQTALHRSSMSAAAAQQGDTANPFGTGPVEYDPAVMATTTMASQRAATRGKLVNFAKQVAPQLRGSIELQDMEIRKAMETIYRRVSTGNAAGHSIDVLMKEAGRPSLGASKSCDDLRLSDSARSVMSEASMPTVRLSRVAGAMVNVLSTARIDKKLAHNRRKTERFGQDQDELRRRVEQISNKSKDLSILTGLCGTETAYLYQPDGRTFRKMDALGGSYSRDFEEEDARRQSLAEAAEMHQRSSGGPADMLGLKSHRFRVAAGTKPLVAPLTTVKGSRTLDRISASLDLPSESQHALQHRARARLNC